MIVIGTAGHIDHGKSAIVKRLTGTDPDRLPEEKARGMTIDLGFAFYHTSEGRSVALVDVPGHERFVKNMIAGAGGIDAVAMVVAADDGWMPQSEEHFQITRLLGVKHGLIVINKTDLVEPDWLELLEAEVSERVAGSFLEDAPVCKVSAHTGEGFDELKQRLEELAGQVESKKDIGKARLYIDRSFIRQGIGGVVTGTLRGGNFSVGQSVTLWPSEKSGKVRTLQSNSRDVETAAPGQRTAVSFTGVEREYLVRGGVISDRQDLGYFGQHPVLAVSVEMLHNAPVPLVDRRKVLLIVGTSEVEGEVRLSDRKALKASESGVVFFKPEDPAYTLVGDHFIVRLPTPMITLGGGRVLDHLEHFPRRKQLALFDYLKDRLKPDLEALVLSELKKGTLVNRKTLLENSDFSQKQIKDEVGRLRQAKAIGRSGEYLYLDATLAEAVRNLKERLEEHLKDQPHLKGLAEDLLRSHTPLRGEILSALLEYMVATEVLSRTGEQYDLAGRGVSLKGVTKQAYDRIMDSLRKDPFGPPKLSQLASGKIEKQAIGYIMETGEAHKCGADFLFLTAAWSEIVVYVRAQLEASGEMSVAAIREKFGLTRKYVIPILEETDRIGLTARQGDVRIKGAKFES
ncbi:MAG: selenocysteine-specific translation elongation factor [bacterium]|nr:selenocysteine-specific translation elongation factor [bacterium]